MQPLKSCGSGAQSWQTGDKLIFRSSEKSLALQRNRRPQYHYSSGYFHSRSQLQADEQSQVLNSLS